MALEEVPLCQFSDALRYRKILQFSIGRLEGIERKLLKRSALVTKNDYGVRVSGAHRALWRLGVSEAGRSCLGEKIVAVDSGGDPNFPGYVIVLDTNDLALA